MCYNEDMIILRIWKNQILKFCLLFLCIYIFLAFIFCQEYVTDLLNGHVSSWIALHASLLLKIFGIEAYVQGNSLCGSMYTLTIVKACTAYNKMELFISAVIAYPSQIRHKFVGCILGALIIYFLNLIRVVSLFITGLYFRNSFDMIHEHVTQTVFTFLVAVLWLLWISRANKTASKQ